jgi:xanthosine utilization system XapX-like protein
MPCDRARAIAICLQLKTVYLLRQHSNFQEYYTMSNPSETQTPHPDNLRAAYQALCSSYNAIDTFRGQLLGFLPLASGSIFALFNFKEVKPELISLIGIFGFLITCGLFIFEIYGIRRCTHLIVLGQHLEQQMTNHLQSSNLNYSNHQ